jgi:hypothetical protein
VRIRVGKDTLVRDVVVHPATPAGRGVASVRIQSVFEKVHVDWSDPLNPDQYAAWHASLAAAADRVTKHDGSITLTTSAHASAIREASLTVDAADWHPTRKWYQLESGTEIEISEVSFHIGTSQVPADVSSHRTDAAPVATIADDGFLATEMEVRSAMHVLGADLGESWEIHRSPDGGVIVKGMIGDRDKLALAQQRISQIPHVHQQLESAGATLPGFIATDGPSTQVISPEPVKPALEDKLKASFPDQAVRTAHVNAVLSASDEQLIRVLAVKRLALRYTPSVEAELDDTSKRKLRDILDDHIGALRSHSASLAGLLEPLLDLSPEPAREAMPAGSWQERSEATFQSVRTIDQLCTELLIGVAHPTRDASQSERLLKERYSVLRNTLDRFWR